MLRGDVRLVNLDPVRAGESSKTRPAIIVSNDALNTTSMSLGRGVVTVVPITSSVEKVYPFQVHIARGESGLRADSKAQAEQIRSVSVSRIGKRLGRLSAESRDRLDIALRLHLNL
jgi:mRNA interferase MazF